MHTAFCGTHCFGAAGGVGGADFAKGGKLINEAASSIGNAIRKGVHPAVTKAATKTIKKAAKYIGKSFGKGLLEDLSYNGVYEFASWYTNSTIDRMFGR